MFDNDYDIEEREIKVPYFDNTAIISQKGPYGHWFIRLARGQCPKEFEGAFTHYDVASKLIKAHETLKKSNKELR